MSPRRSPGGDETPGPLPGYPEFPFRGRPPSREDAVLGHRIKVHLRQWRTALPDEWLPPTFRTDEPWVWVHRRDVFELAKSAGTAVGAFHTYVAAAAWGSRPGREVGRRLIPLRELQDADREAMGAKLAAVTRMLPNGPVEAYDALVHGEHYIPGIRTAFGTKYLYFTGYRPGALGLRPLILDDNTAQALRWLTGRSFESLAVGSDGYHAYLLRLHEWAGAWCDGGCEPDVVERALFSVGQAGRMAVSVLSGAPSLS